MHAHMVDIFWSYGPKIPMSREYVYINIEMEMLGKLLRFISAFTAVAKNSNND